MRAVILAAGFGTRLWPLTEDRTKPAIPFLNRPLISYSVQYLTEQGIRSIIVNLHHHPESIRDALGNGSQYAAEIEYSYEEQILGTSGALDRVRDMLGDGDFVVMNGKIITAIDLSAAIEHHRKNSALATLVLRPNPARERFSTVEVDTRGWIKGFGPHPTPPDPGAESNSTRKTQSDQQATEAAPSPGESDQTPLMFTGIQILSPRIFEYIPPGVFSHSTVHVYPKAIQAGEAVIGFVSDDDWYEVSTLDRYLEASLRFLHKKGEHVVAGRDCVIETGATVRDSVLWDRVVVETGARVERSVIGDGVRLPSGSNICRAVVVRAGAAGRIERGTVMGENLIVPID
jgi:NDP-sugar pyrophosphorylase family protein